MTWSLFGLSSLKTRGAALGAALSLFGFASFADPAVIRSVDGGLRIEGTVLAFDGELLTARTAGGVVALRYQGLTCEGEGCPADPYVPLWRLAVAEPSATLLVPALFEAYARDRAIQYHSDGAMIRLSDDGEERLRVELVQTAADAGTELFMRQVVQGLVSGQGFEADTLARLEAEGLGRADTSRQQRILALAALVPVTVAGGDLRQIELTQLGRALTRTGTAPTIHLVGQPGETLPAGLSRLLDSDDLRRDVVWHGTAQDLRETLESGAPGIGLLPARDLGALQPLSIGGSCGLTIRADYHSLKSEDYPFSYPIALYLPPWRQHPQIAAFLDWVRTPAAQLVVRRAGLVDLGAAPIPLNAQGNRLAGSILAAGPEVSLMELQRMVGVLRDRTRLSSTFRFEPGSTRLDGASRSQLLSLAQAMKDGHYTGRELTLVGFSDGRGAADANRDLSAARAEAVKEDLVAALAGEVPFGVTIETEAFGEAMPIACDDTPLGQEINRRVELWVRDRS